VNIASIDIGSNSFKLLIANINNNLIIPVFQLVRYPRLGENLIHTHLISNDSIKQAENAIAEIVDILSKQKPYKTLAIGTAVLRDAKNGNEVCDILSGLLGEQIRIIDGEEEAYLSYIGVQTTPGFDKGKFSTLDIGGGSTEIITGEKNKIHYRISIPIGAAKIHDLFFKENIYSEENINDANDYISEKIQELNTEAVVRDAFFGVGGTISTSAFISSGLKVFSEFELNGLNLNDKDLSSLINSLKVYSPNDISEKFGINPKRADILIPGQLILKSILKYLQLENINISTRGLRFGIIQDYLNKSNLLQAY